MIGTQLAFRHYCTFLYTSLSAPQSINLWQPVHLNTYLINTIFRMNHYRFLEVVTFFQTNHFQFCLTKQVDGWDTNRSVCFFIGRQSFVFQIFPEGVHIVCPYTKDIQCFYLSQTFWQIAGIIAAIERRASFQGILIAFQAHTTTKELNDLRTFTTTYVHQSHSADTPAAPPFAKLLGTDKDVYGGIIIVDVRKQRIVAKLRCLTVQVIRITQLDKRIAVTHIDNSEVRSISYAQTYLSVTTFLLDDI